jgi:NAD(P)-dependent dehydrogenase (short-subunit alcohol dehydrogenase family)
VLYSAAKGAVKIFTQELSREFGSRGITVNHLRPPLLFHKSYIPTENVAGQLKIPDPG